MFTNSLTIVDFSFCHSRRLSPTFVIGDPGLSGIQGSVPGGPTRMEEQKNLDPLNSQTKCNTLLRCCHGTLLYTTHP